MFPWRWLLMVCVASMVVLTPTEGTMERPKKPEHFETIEQVRDYLNQLKEYYSIIARGRYGKRNIEPLPSTLRIYRQLENLLQKQERDLQRFVRQPYLPNYNHFDETERY